MAAPAVVTLPWSGECWPGRIQDGIPTFAFRCAPPGLATRRQLRARGLCPGGQDYVAQLLWRRDRRWAALYRLDLAQPSRTPTPAQRAALERAMAARRTCRACGSDVGYCLPRSADRRCWPCTVAAQSTGVWWACRWCETRNLHTNTACRICQRAAAAAECVFCRIIAGQAPATVLRRWSDAIAIAPRHPVTAGHALVIPTVHVRDAGIDRAISASAMAAAADLAAEHPDCNVITSRGQHATQTVFHLHIHVVPRHDGDGLTLPWTGQVKP